MVRFFWNPRVKDVFDAVGLWKANCLLKDGSVFADSQIWTSSNLQDLHTHFVEAPILGHQRFIEKFRSQLESAFASSRKLAAEAIWFMWLFPSNISHKMKVSRIREVWGWSGDSLDPLHPMLAGPLEQGIGNAGAGYNTRFPVELAFFLGLTRLWKRLPETEQTSLLGDGWRFGNWIDGIAAGRVYQVRHMMLYLLFPDQYERTSSSGQKQTISKAFAGTVGFADALEQVGVDPPDSPAVQLDKRLLAIRRALQVLHPGDEIDFYREPVKSLWQEGSEPAGKQEEQAEVAQSRRYWVEKTIVVGRKDREDGPNRMGAALWSPQKSEGNQDIYANMRVVRPGDLVLHLIDNKQFAGVSVVDSPVDDSFQGVAPTEWGTQPSYRIALRDYEELDPPLEREDFLESADGAAELRRVQEKFEGKGLFFNRKMTLRQGAYLTTAPVELIESSEQDLLQALWQSFAAHRYDGASCRGEHFDRLHGR